MSDSAKTLDKATRDKVGLVKFIIGEFFRLHRMNRQQAYLYLKQYGGLKFLSECRWALHTDNPTQSVHEINQVCQSNGGVL